MISKNMDKENQEVLKELGSFLRDYRYFSGLTQADVAMDANIHIRTLQNLERGKSVTTRTILNVTKILGVDLLKEIG